MVPASIKKRTTEWSGYGFANGMYSLQRKHFVGKDIVFRCKNLAFFFLFTVESPSACRLGPFFCHCKVKAVWRERDF